MSKIMRNSYQKYKYLKGNKHSINKMNITSTSKNTIKNILLSNESQEISKYQYSPIMQSRKLKKDHIITLTKKPNCNNNSPNNIPSNPKYLKKSKKVKKNQTNKNKKELKYSYNDNSGSIPKDYERVHKRKSKKSELLGGRKKIKSFYKLLSFDPDINHDEIKKRFVLNTSRNNDKNYIKILNTEDNEKVGIPKNLSKFNNTSTNKISNKSNIKNKESTLIDDEVNTEIENITEAEETNRKIVNFPNLSTNPFLKEKSKLQSNLGKSSNSIIKTSIGTNLNSSSNESNRISIELVNTIKVISNISQENQTINSKINELNLYDNFLYFSQILQLPKELINLNYQDEKGYSALHYSSEEGNQKIVEFLIKEKCDINLRTKEYKTALHLCIIYL